MTTKQRKKRTRCNPGVDEALVEFLALGQGRTIPKLRKRLLSRPKKWTAVPGLSLLKRWSAVNGWVARSIEHDAQVAARTSEKTIEIQAGERASVFEGLENTVQDLLALLRGAMRDVTIKTVEHLKDLSAVIVALSAHSLDLQRGKQPDASLIEALVREKMLGNGSIDRAGGEPTVDDLTKAVAKALLEETGGTKH